ncbi:hypothetical protein Tco_0287163 [Tanacetum coccineum]
MNMELVLMAKAFKLNYSTLTNNNQRISSTPHNRQIAQPGMNMDQNRHANVKAMRRQNVGNQNGLIVVLRIANQNPNGNGNVVAAQDEGNVIRKNGNQNKVLQLQRILGSSWLVNLHSPNQGRMDEKAGIQLQPKEFDLMDAVGDLDENEDVNANCILMANLQQASISGTQTDKALVFDSDGSSEVQLSDNCYNNDIFNMFTQEEQYIELLNPIPEPHQVQQNDSNVIYEDSSMEHLSKEKSTVSSLLEEKKKLKSDLKIRKDELVDKQIQLENKIK